ncbi:MAG: hypothetical protein LWW84_14395 [Azovibrio sp.]|nr:hypothetical protein [Azovibrio sp.]
MSIKLYTGRMGSGKTYEVVSVVILGALARGRRVVSNIAGLNYEAMQAVLVESGVPPDQVGQLVQVTHAQVEEPQFWRTDKDEAEGVDSFIQPGDLVCLDEIWRFWEGFAGRKMPERVMNFYRMHRHFAHPETGVTCDVALITQDPGDLSRRVRAVVEETYRMEKLTAVGMSRRYRVDIFSGCSSRPQFLRSLQRTYEKKYFPLYKSHSQAKDDSAGPREENIDQRGNILRGALFKVVLPVMALVGMASVYFVWSFLHPEPPPKAKPAQAGAGKPAGGANTPAPAGAAPLPGMNSRFRVVGYVAQGSNPRVYLAYDETDRARIFYKRQVVESHNWKMTLKAPDGQITEWSGSKGKGEKTP